MRKLPKVPNPLLTHEHAARDHVIRVVLSVAVVVALYTNHLHIAILTNLVWIWTDID